MSLNDNVLEDLDEDIIVDNDVIKQPDNVEDIDTAPVKATESIASLDNYVEHLMTAIEHFKTAHNAISNITEIEEVNDKVMAMESISMSHARDIDEVLEGALISKVAIEEYTILPSKTNYKFTLNVINASLEEHKENAHAVFNDLIENSLPMIKSICDKLTSEVIDNAKQVLFLTNREMFEIVESFKSNKNLVVSQDGKLVNVFTSDVSLLDFNKVEIASEVTDKVSKDQAIAAMSKINSTLESELIKSYIMSCANSEIPNISNSTMVATYKDSPVTLCDLARVLSSSIVSDSFTEIYENTVLTVKAIEKLQEDYDKCKGMFDDASQLICDNSVDVQHMLHSTSACYKLIVGVTGVIVNSKDVFNYINQF